MRTSFALMFLNTPTPFFLVRGTFLWKSREEDRGHERVYHDPRPESGKQGLLCNCPTVVTFMEMKV
ncbi:hypothetical protein I7I53_05410 [Histoplasma capsulatum var. duboisii H88]|uniref:Uncharacterized protein n=1 Tax=Ajellomyces capsulatus (strain H88) TaxID=544711 RepID=A0A8A1LYM4_AJEC8|nr:hypothetical protein I7I53_05410 [Histoplasma capsulatum var. duboisii H88]